MSAPDVLVIGAGPGGCVAAIEHAQRGHRVWLCEAKPNAAERRLGGEWMHNTGRLLLDELGVDLSGAHEGEGFVVHPGDASDGIVLPYVQPELGPVGRILHRDSTLPSAARGFSWEHADLVERIRERAQAQPGVHYHPHARVSLELREDTGELDARVDFRDGRSQTVRPDRIVDASGKAGIGRRALGIVDPIETVSVSRMIGLELLDVEVPTIGYGHVFLGGPGPMLMYRIREHSVRVIVDIPSWFAAGRKPTHEELATAWGNTLPGPLAHAFERALREGQGKWVNVGVRVRANYGHDRLALLGDAVGHYHPLTAAGMTNAVLDARSLAQHESVEGYARERTRTSKSAGLLGVALYDMFSRPEPESARMRAALYERWRKDPKERRRTMGYLGMGDQRVTAFMSSYIKVVTGGFAGARPGERIEAVRQSANFIQNRVPWLLKSFGAKTAVGGVMVPQHAEAPAQAA